MKTFYDKFRALRPEHMLGLMLAMLLLAALTLFVGARLFPGDLPDDGTPVQVAVEADWNFWDYATMAAGIAWFFSMYFWTLGAWLLVLVVIYENARHWWSKGLYVVAWMGMNFACLKALTFISKDQEVASWNLYLLAGCCLVVMLGFLFGVTTDRPAKKIEEVQS